MKYLNKSFSVDYGSPEYRQGWELTFGKQSEKEMNCETCNKNLSEKPSPCESCPLLTKQISEE